MLERDDQYTGIKRWLLYPKQNPCDLRVPYVLYPWVAVWALVYVAAIGVATIAVLAASGIKQARIFLSEVT